MLNNKKDKNENKLVKFLDFLNLDGFISYNFGACPPTKEPTRLTTQNIPHKIRTRLRKIQGDLGWTNEEVMSNLKIPKHKKVECFSYNAMYFKYVYSYYMVYKTDLFDINNHVSDDDIIKPVDNPVLFATLLL